MIKTPDYQIREYRKSTFSKRQLRQILAKLPIVVEVKVGHSLSLEARASSNNHNPTIMVDYHGAQLISLSPQKGMRLADAYMFGPLAKEFTPSRIMDETGGGGACCSYYSNTKKLGLDFNVDFGIDIYKLG